MSDSFATSRTVAPQALLSMEFPRKNTGVGCHFLLLGLFPTQGSNSIFCIGKQILYHWATREGPCSLFRAWLLLLFYTFPISNFNKPLQQASLKISFLVSFYVLGCKALTEFLSNSNSTYYFYFLVVISLTMFLFLN